MYIKSNAISESIAWSLTEKYSTHHNILDLDFPTIELSRTEHVTEPLNIEYSGIGWVIQAIHVLEYLGKRTEMSGSFAKHSGWRSNSERYKTQKPKISCVHIVQNQLRSKQRLPKVHTDIAWAKTSTNLFQTLDRLCKQNTTVYYPSQPTSREACYPCATAALILATVFYVQFRIRPPKLSLRR